VNAPDEQTGVKPTIVLVHGAFADASSWNGVIGRLQQQGYTVIATANPLRGLAADSAYTASLLNQIDGPTARRTRTPAPTPANSPASTSTVSSRAASDTTCRKRLRRLSPKPSSTPIGTDR
jgi:pimeloyl-ACP methyl ester carboxylesterase